MAPYAFWKRVAQTWDTRIVLALMSQSTAICESFAFNIKDILSGSFTRLIHGE